MQTLLHLLHGLATTPTLHWLQAHSIIKHSLNLLSGARSLEWLWQKVTPRPAIMAGEKSAPRPKVKEIAASGERPLLND